MLSLAQMELILFIAAPVVLCFGCVTKPRLMAHQWLVCGWVALAQHQGFFFSHSRLGVGRGLGGDTTQTAGSGWPEGYSMLYNVMLSNKNWGEQVLGEVAVAWGRQLLLRGWFWHHSAYGRWWVISLASLLVFFFLLLLSFTYWTISWPMNSFTHALSVLSHCPMGAGD